jgi:hypothetical protein
MQPAAQAAPLQLLDLGQVLAADLGVAEDKTLLRLMWVSVQVTLADPDNSAEVGAALPSKSPRMNFWWKILGCSRP